MFLYEYIIKLLISNSGNLFLGLVVVVFGYFGWLIWNINDRLKKYAEQWKEHESKVEKIKVKLDDFDEGVYRDLLIKIEKIYLLMEKALNKILDNEKDLQEYKREVVEEIKESAEEIKEITKILLNNRSRSLSFKKEKDKQE